MEPVSRSLAIGRGSSSAASYRKGFQVQQDSEQKSCPTELTTQSKASYKMATDKPAVMTYLDSVIYQRLVVFKDQQQIRSLSKAIELILGEYFGIAGKHSMSDESHLLNCNILKQNELLAETVGRLTEVLDSQGQLYRQLQLFQLLKLSAAEQPVPQQEDANDPTSDFSSSFTDEFEQSLRAIGLSLHIAQQGLTGVKLAVRLKVSASTLSRRRLSPGFIEWSLQVDPQGVGWKFMGATRRFHPIVKHELMSKMGCMAEMSQIAEIK